MKFALNYSIPAAKLLRESAIALDLFKCPAWPDMIAEARALHSVYVHCPLRVGMGTGAVEDTETHRAADWAKYDRFLDEGLMPWASLHMTTRTTDHPDIPLMSRAPAHVARVAEALIRDVDAAVARLGAERVVVENIFGFYGRHLWAAALPETTNRVVEATGCGLLLDLSHARLAARDLGVDPRAYVSALPVAHLRELHVTGLQVFAGRWMKAARRAGLRASELDGFAGRLIDHLPMTEPDWDFLAWALAQIRSGAWATPQIVAYEYGGVGGVYQAITERDVLAAQVPRMRGMIRAEKSPVQHHP